jgi:hypothetical protein
LAATVRIENIRPRVIRVVTTAIGVALLALAACSPTPAHRIPRPLTDGAPIGGGVGGAGGSGGRADAAPAGGAGGAGGAVTGGSSGGGGGGGTGGAGPSTGVTCADAEPWMGGADYKAGKVVTNGTPRHRYECKPFPFEGWCKIAAYEPGKVGAPWMDAWIDLGACP